MLNTSVSFFFAISNFEGPTRRPCATFANHGNDEMRYRCGEQGIGHRWLIADNAAGTPVAADEFLYNSVAGPRIRIIVEIEILGTV